VTPSDLRAAACGAAALIAVGTSFAVAAELTEYPRAGGQAVRYAGATLLLLAVLRGRLPRPSVRDLALLTALAAIGLAAFNLLVIAAVDAGDAATVGVVVGCVPVVLAVAAPLAARRPPDPRLVGAALVVAAGAALVQGLGPAVGAAALLLAVGALFCEAAFSLLAAPLLGRLGAIGVSAWACLLAVPLLAVAGLVADGPGGVLAVPTTTEALALGYLTVVVTAAAFVLWYTAVRTLGAGCAGLLSGLMPVSALLAAVALGHSDLDPGRLAGVLGVAAGITAGLRAGRATTARRAPRRRRSRRRARAPRRARASRASAGGRRPRRGSTRPARPRPGRPGGRRSRCRG